MSYRPSAPSERGSHARRERAPAEPSHPAPEPREKRALSHVGGPTEVAGDPAMAEILAYALDVRDATRDRLTHGFHTYPARMHWATCARLYEALELRSTHVLDPFCGSGTTLVEARAHGLTATGTDLNPLAVRLARVKCETGDRAYRESLVLTANEVRSASEALVQARAKVRADLPPGEVQWYEPHVLKEMAGLAQCISAVDDPRVREAFIMVFSSLVVKFSRQRSDTAEEAVSRTIRKGLVSEFFERKAGELADRLEALSQEPLGPRARIEVADAREVADVLSRPVDVVLTSPPYGGTYDYAAHHARRFAWLGIPLDAMTREIGARRSQGAPERFERQLFEVLSSLARVVRRDGLLVLLMGDGQHHGERVPADELVASMCEDAGFRPLAVASQPRPDFSGGAFRSEHLMALVRD